MNWRETADRTLALTGVVVAVCAAVITFYQVHLMREQAKIAVWPHVEQYNTTEGGKLFKRIVYNAGLGPAVIRYFGVKVDGRTLHDWGAVARQLAENPDASHHYQESDLPPGFVLLQGEKITVLAIVGADSTKAIARHELLVTTICYCSLYGDCWISRSTTNLNERVKRCPNAETSGFYAGRNALSKPAASGPN